MRAKPYIVVATFVLVLGACTSDPASDRTPPAQVAAGSSPAADVLLLDTDAGPVAVSPSTGSILSGEAGAVAGPDGTRLYTTTLDGDHTVLVVRDAATDDQLSTTAVPGDLAVRVASDSGNAVALMAPLPDGVDPWTPVPRARTTIVVADPSGARPARTYHLRGNYEPEAFSVEDSRLFLIQYLPAEAPAVYRVTVLDLADGDVYEVHGRFKTAPERMPGIRLRQVFDRDDVAALHALHDRAARRRAGLRRLGLRRSRRDVRARVEPGAWMGVLRRPSPPVLGRARGRAGDRAVPGWLGALHRRLDARSGGRHEHADAADRAVGEGGRLVARRRAHLGAGERGRPDALRRLGRGRSRRLRDRHGDAPGRASLADERGRVGLGLSVDGRRLYVALRDGVAVLDAGTGQELTTVPFLGIESILQVASVPDP